MTFYYIPLKENKAKIGTENDVFIGYKTASNGRGYAVYDDSYTALPRELKNFNPYCYQEGWMMIEASSASGAIKSFYKTHPGAKVGGKGLTFKAVQINRTRTRAIIEIPDCQYRDNCILSPQIIICTCYGKLRKCVIESNRHHLNGPERICIMENFLDINDISFPNPNHLPPNYILKKISVETPDGRYFFYVATPNSERL